MINAEQDARVPQHLVKHHGIRSYLGIPVVANYDPVVATPRPVGVALVATCLSFVAARMASLGLSGGIWMEVQDLGSQAGVTIEADELRAEALQGIAAELSLHTRETPSAALQATDEAIRLSFAVVQEGS